MACDKIYGSRRVFIAAETDGVAGTFYEIRVQSIEVPKIFAETVDIDESTGYRGVSNYVSGNINELTGTLSVNLPATLAAVGGGAMGILFRGAGMGANTDIVYPQNTGSCGNTFSIYTIDRTGMLAERLSGCIITNFKFTFNRSDSPSISFSYQAAKKEEFWCSNSETVTASASTITLAGGSYNNGLDKAVSLSSGYMPVKIGDEETGYISAVSDAGAITVTRSSPSASGTVKVMPDIPAGAVEVSSRVVPVSNRGWKLKEGDVDFNGKLQSMTISAETGMSYGELIVGHDYVSEVLVGTLAITGSLTVYVNLEAGSMGNGYNLNANHGFAVAIGDYFINLPGVKFTECPDLSLAKDEPCSGDFAFKCYNSGTGLDCFGIDDSNWSVT